MEVGVLEQRGFYRPLEMTGATHGLWERSSKQQSWIQAMFQVPPEPGREAGVRNPWGCWRLSWRPEVS